MVRARTCLLVGALGLVACSSNDPHGVAVDRTTLALSTPESALPPLDGWWRGYPGAPWPGSASAGSSGTHDALDAGTSVTTGIPSTVPGVR